jgi:transcriptional regulator with XRE-family HTH domain
MTTAEIGQAMKFRRDFLKLSQVDLAEMSGITIRTIHMIEKGIGNPSAKTLEKLAIVLGMELVIRVKQL